MTEWLTVGDFNAVTGIDDASNKENFQNHRCLGMRNWIFKEGLIDLCYSGARFTWTRCKDNTTFTRARLDRSLCNTNWILRYPETKVRHLARIGWN